MKKLYLFFISLFVSFSFISTFALSNDDVFNYVYSDIVWSEQQIKPIVLDVLNKSNNMFTNNYYLVEYNNGFIYFTFLDKLTSELTVYSVNSQTGSVVLENTFYAFWQYNINGSNIYQLSWNNHQVFNWNLFENNGHIMYSNLPIVYTDNNGKLTYVINRTIPYTYFPNTHELGQPPVEVLPGEQVDSIVDTNLTTILDEFDIDLLFENLESVLQQIYGFIESSFLSLNEVITYITSSLNNVVSFITANITIISIISMVYLALPSILRDLFTLALSTSVVFIMLRRFI